MRNQLSGLTSVNTLLLGLCPQLLTTSQSQVISHYNAFRPTPPRHFCNQDDSSRDAHLSGLETE